MNTKETGHKKPSTGIRQAKRFLIVGPLPPPIGGSPLTLQAMLEELTRYQSVKVKIINTSPATDVRKDMTGFKFEKVWRTIYLLFNYAHEMPRADATLVFANDLFAITLVPLLLLLAQLFNKPFFLKPVGAGLDLFINRQKKLLRKFILFILRSTDGILAQSRLLKDDLIKLGCTNVHYLPGCRSLPVINPVQRESSSGLRIIFLGHITRLKGPLILLETLKIISNSDDQNVTCDFYGPIHDEIRDEFLEGLKLIPGAHYCGMAEPGTGAQLIANYDVLALPTYYQTEGHPGVLIEAMHAGVPVITTQIRTISDLVTNGINGLLVPPKDSQLLAAAITLLATDPLMRKEMGQANHLKGEEFRTDIVVTQLLKIVFPDLSPLK